MAFKIKFTFKQLVIIHIILILILIGLMIKIKIQEKNYDCEKCIIKFRQYDKFASVENFVVKVPLVKLYQGYINNSCPIKWDKTGYVFNEKLNISFRK